MAKGQKKSTREVRKPKAQKAKPAALTGLDKKPVSIVTLKS